MLELGKVQELIVVKKVDFGVYLAQQEGDTEKVLLPARQVPHDAGIGSRIEVFLYKDSKDRLISTTARPRLTLGEVAELAVDFARRCLAPAADEPAGTPGDCAAGN